MVIRMEYPGKVFAVAVVTGPKSTCMDDALAVARRRQTVHGGTWMVSDTEWTECLILEEVNGVPEVAYMGSVTEIGDHLRPGEYQAINPRNTSEPARTYTVTDEGTAYYKMK